MSVRLSVVQFQPILGDKVSNIERLLGYCRTIDSDVIVFPELCTTGYFFQNREETSVLAESGKGETVTCIQEIASATNKIIIFGYIESEDNKIYNSAAVVFPENSKTRSYRKTHLFYKERFCFDAGDTGFFVIEDDQKNIKIGTMICYDWRFPEASRTLGLLGADLIVCPSNLVTNIWTKVMPARAIENKVYLAVANRTGLEEANDETVLFNGLSGIWSYNGDRIASAEAVEDCVLSVEIEPEKTRDKSFNEFNDIFADRRTEFYL